MGKVLASLCYAVPPHRLLVITGARVLLVPLLCLSVAPRSAPFFEGDGWAFLFAALLGVSNGVCGSLPMILAPLHVPGELKELTGNLMTLSYALGLTSGALLAYAIDYALGPRQEAELACALSPGAPFAATTTVWDNLTHADSFTTLAAWSNTTARDFANTTFA